jgi:hypothetical protein
VSDSIFVKDGCNGIFDVEFFPGMVPLIWFCLVIVGISRLIMLLRYSFNRVIGCGLWRWFFFIPFTVPVLNCFSVNELTNLSVFNFNNLISIKANIINNDTIYKIKTIEIQCISFQNKFKKKTIISVPNIWKII